MKIYLKQFPQNSTDKLQTEFQSNLDKLQNQINECKCSENILTKPNGKYPFVFMLNHFDVF